MSSYEGRRRKPLAIWQKLLLIPVVPLVVYVVGTVVSDAYQRLVDHEIGANRGPEVNDASGLISSADSYRGLILEGTPESVGRVPTTRFDKDIVEWAKDRPKYDARTSSIALDIGSPHGRIVIQNVEIEVVSRAGPAMGVFVPPIGAGDYFDRALDVDLDSDPPMVTRYSDNADWDYPISVGPDDTYFLSVVARAEAAAVKWKIRIDYTVDGQTKSQLVDNNGKPYATSGTAGATHTWSPQAGWLSGHPTASSG